MVSSSTSAIFRLAGWYYIPDFATQNLLRIIHSVFRKFHVLPPAPQTPQYFKQYRYTFATVIIGFLLYNLIQGALSLEPNFYELLAVPPQVDEGGLKIAFRAFARKYHPDKIARDGGEGGEEVFMSVRDAFEALKDPVVRFAYDRFGPDVLTWSHCKTTREFIRQGLINFSVYHSVTFVGLLFWTSIGDSPTSFWRYLIFAALSVAELSLLLSPSPTSSSSFMNLFVSSPTGAPEYSNLLHIFFPGRVVYQHIQFLRQLFMVLSVALARVAPQLFPEDPKASPAAVERLRALTAVADREASVMLHTELHSISRNAQHRISLATMQPHPPPPPNEPTMDTLLKEIEDMLIEGNIKQNVGPLRSVWEAAVARGRGKGSGSTDSAAPSDGWDYGLSPTREGETPKLHERFPSPAPPTELTHRGSVSARARRLSF